MAIKKLPSTGDTPRATGVPASLLPGGEADSAGFPWAGRTFDHHETAFADDDGSAPLALSSAVAGVREAAAAWGHAIAKPVDASIEPARDGAQWAEALNRLADAHADALQALSKNRVLIPLLAEAGDVGLTPEGRTVEKTQELSIVTIASPDGRRAMPVFSSVDSMRAWNAGARPIPVPAPQAAVAAAQEATDLIIVDPGSPEHEFGVRRTQLESLALGQRVVPAWADPAVRAAFEESVAGEQLVVSIELHPGDPEARLLAQETEVRLALVPGLERELLAMMLPVFQQRWAASQIIADRVDSLSLKVRRG